MKLISCERCGVVIDTDRLVIPPIYDYDMGQALLSSEYFEYFDGKFYPTITCPVCSDKIVIK